MTTITFAADYIADYLAYRLLKDNLTERKISSVRFHSKHKSYRPL